MGQSSSVDQVSPQPPQQLNTTPTEALADAEAQDNYLAAIQASSINRRARENYVYQPMNSTFLSTDDYNSDRQFPKGRIITMMPSAEAGFPHTRGTDIICIPAYYPEDNMASLLIHERIHLHQKALRKEYANFYEKFWDFKPNIYPIPEDILSRMRINPDTIGWPIYIWKDTWIPLCLFEREDRPNMRECTYCWYNPKGGVLLKSTPPAWREFFGDMHQSEHLNELSACYGADFQKYYLVQNKAATLFYTFLFTKEHFYSENSSTRE